MELAHQEDEFISSSSNDLSHHQIVKGKRTKRHRSSSPEKTVINPSATTIDANSHHSTTSSSGGGGGNYNNVTEELCNYGASISISSPASNNSSEVYQSSSTEEEDMAYCLILLAQGDGVKPHQPPHRHHRRRRIDVDDDENSAQKVFDVSSTTRTRSGFFVYECKTCNRSFPSFQALGGHRASHRKPKTDLEKKLGVSIPIPDQVPSSIEDHHHELNFESQLNKQIDHQQVQQRPFCVQLSANKASKSSAKIHECSICGSEFNSGQALGGHMRRHRAANNNGGANSNNMNNQVMISTTIDDHHDDQIQVKPAAARNILSLDLNLPAPEDDHHHRESKFQFVSTQQALVFSSPALVDCYY